MSRYKPLFAHLFGWTPDQVEALTWADWQIYRAWADEIAPTGGRAGLMAQHPALGGRRG